MLYKAKSLMGYRFIGLDGDIGKVNELFFDDHHWAVRYLLADTGEWLAGRQVLISPYAILDLNQEERCISINLTKKQIEASPSLERNKPVLQQFEMAYYGYYGWPKYWHGPYMWGAFSYVPRDRSKWGEANRHVEGWSPHLHSTVDLLGHHIQASDGEFGHVEDFIIDEEVWAIRYLIIDTQNWWPGKKVLVSPLWIEGQNWQESKVSIGLTRAAIEKAPEYSELATLNREYEAILYRHYNRQVYW